MSVLNVVLCADWYWFCGLRSPVPVLSLSCAGWSRLKVDLSAGLGPGTEAASTGRPGRGWEDRRRSGSPLQEGVVGGHGGLWAGTVDL